MESNSNIKRSSKSILLILTAISIFAFVIFYFAAKKLNSEYQNRLLIPGQLIENKVADYDIINNRVFLKSLINEDIVQCAIIGTNGKIYYSITKSLIDKDYWDIDELNSINNKDKTKNIFTRIKNSMKYFSNTTELYNNNGENIGYLLIITKKSNYKKELLQLALYVIGSIFILTFIYFSIFRIILKNISKQRTKILDSLKELNLGNLNLSLKTDDKGESDVLQEYYDNFVISLREKSKFSLEIKNRNFEYEFTPLSDKDELGKSLLELRDSLKKATDEEEERKKQEEITNWITNGVARFSEILRKDVDSLEQLGYNVISNLVEYLNANQGGFFLIEDDELNKEKIIELKAAYAFNRKKHYERKLAWGEGLIGASIQEKKSTYLTKLPDDYINISSGLGESNPNCLLIVPLSSGDIQYGAIEIASLKEFKEYHIDFVNRISEIIASTISTVKNTEKTKLLLKETQEQSERIKQTEEELRQNMEEMQATQEEVERTNEQLKKNEEILKKQTEELTKEKYLMDALLDNVQEYIYIKDQNSKFIKVSRSLARSFGHEDPAEILMKSDFDFFDNEHAQPSLDDEQRIMKTGKPLIDKIEKEIKDDGRVTWVTTTKMPLRDQDGKIVGTFGVSKDITAVKQLELDAIKAKENLEFENLLFTTLMDHITARITYKDTEAKYLRINKTKEKALGIKDQAEVLGKTDHDIFGDSHGGDFIKKEIENINMGLTSLNNKELIKYKDGRLSWGSTSRIPIKNKENKVLGGLVITWDVTEQENALLELDMYKDIFQNICTELSVTFIKLDNDKKIIKISGNGIKLLNFKNESDAKNNFFKTFPKLLTKLNKHKGYDTIEEIQDMKIKNEKYHIRNIIIPHKMTTLGYTGITVMHKI